MKKYKRLEFKEEKVKIKEITNSETKKIIDQLSNLADKLVPMEGPADTQEGEMIRAIDRVLHRYWNDGDYFFKGYGKQTAASSANYLATKTPISNKLKSLLRDARNFAKPGSAYEYTDQDMYQHYLFNIASMIIDYVKSKNGKYTPNTYDSR